MFVGTVWIVVAYVRTASLYIWRATAIRSPVLLEVDLQLLEVLARAQLRVGLGDGEQAPDRGREHALGDGLLLDVARALRGRARLGHLLEGRALVRGIALDRLDEVGDEVAAPLQLDIHLRPAVVHAVAEPDQPVVGEHDCGGDQREHRSADQRPRHRPTLTLRGQPLLEA